MHKSLAIAAVLAGVVGPALGADGWDSYLNGRFGYELPVPPGFTGRGEPDAHDGQVFRRGPQTLTVWGGYLPGTFSEEVAGRLSGLAAQGWTITFRSTTPTWASYSGTKGRRVLYVREIAGCTGQQYATFELQYPDIDINATKPTVERLVRGFTQKVCENP